mmetsp:Transcript_34688/g.90757  ORF Transcript_34688/g.90757 Transcript_34688/m.90757 type:complete len:398 (-) Transcript_34688:1395-2588(-)
MVEDLGRLVSLLLVQPVADLKRIGCVGAADKLLHVGEAIGLGVSVDQLCIDEHVLVLGAGHDQVAHQLLEVLLPRGGLDDLRVVGGVLGLQVGLDRLWHLVAVQLRLAELVPHGAFVAAGGKLHGALDVLDVRQERLHGLGVHVALLVDDERLLEEVVLSQRDRGDVWAIVVVQAVDVVHDARLVGLDRRQDQEVLQVLVLAEIGVVQDYFLKELDQLGGKLGFYEGLHGDGDLVRIRRLWQRSAHDLVDDLAPLLIVLVEHHRPEVGALALNEVARLQPEEPVLVGHVHELLVAGAPGALVGRVREVRVAILAVLSDDGGVVEGVGLQELLGVAVRVDVDHRDSIVQVGVLVALRHPRLEPRQQQAQAVPLLDLDHERLDGAGRANVLEQVLDEVL